MNRKVIQITAAALLFSLSPLILADEKVSMRANYFSDNTGTVVKSPAAEFVKDLFGGFEFGLRYSLDRVLIPPINSIQVRPTDGTTGASRPAGNADKTYAKNRSEIIATLSKDSYSASYYYSNELDYVGRMATIATNADFNRKNTNIAGSYSFGWDNIKPTGIDTALTKIAHNINATLTQAIGPKTIGRFGVDFAYLSGFQSNPYRIVRMQNVNIIPIENHPLQRLRGAFFAKLNHYFESKTALNFEYRFYADDWAILSNTMNMYYYQYMKENVLIRYRYRYYTQSASNFYQDIYTGQQAFMTGDYKMEAFSAHLFGLKVEYKLKKLLDDGFFSFLAGSTIDAKYERYFSSNDFTADIFQFGLVLNY